MMGISIYNNRRSDIQQESGMDTMEKKPQTYEYSVNCWHSWQIFGLQ